MICQVFVVRSNIYIFCVFNLEALQIFWRSVHNILSSVVTVFSGAIEIHFEFTWLLICTYEAKRANEQEIKVDLKVSISAIFNKIHKVF